MKVKEESEKVGLKLNIQKTKIMASSPITSWQIDGETMGTVAHFIFLGSKITTDGDCSHEIKRHLLLGRKVMTNLDSMLKSRDITLSTKVRLVKAMVFPVVMYGCESWTIRKAEHWRLDAFELWCWRRLLRVPWPARRSNQSILKEISPEVHWKDWCWSWNSNTLATWWEELTHLKRPWCWERLRAGGEGDNREWNGWMTSPTQWIWVWVDSGVGNGQGGLACCGSWSRKESDTTEWLNWTELNWYNRKVYNWCFWTVVLEKTPKSPLDWKEIKPVHPKGNLSWIFIGRTDAEAEALILWPLDVKNWLIGKDPDAGKDWGQEEKGTTEDEMVGWHHWLERHELKQAPGVGDGQGSLACCSPWGGEELVTTEWLNWYNWIVLLYSTS